MDLSFFAIHAKFIGGKELLNILEKRFLAVLFHIRAA